MKISLRKHLHLSKKEKLTIFFRWFCYSVLLLLLFMLMCSGSFRKWQPILIIPLSVAVAMFEKEFSAAVFGLFCGLMLDTACGYLLGISSLWLMPFSLGISLLIMNLIRVNLLNHLWMTVVTSFVMAFMDYFFNYFIWGLPNNEIILYEYILPSYFSGIVLSPLIYLAVRFLHGKFTLKENRELENPLYDNDTEVLKEKV